MNSESQASARGAKFRKDLDREAIALAMRGEWERAAEVNRAILELFADDVEAMNRLTKSLIEVGKYDEANTVVDRVCLIAPHNNIARKNRTRVDQMRGSSAASTRHARGAAGAPQLFIGESGKSATTTLLHTPRTVSPALVSPGDPVQLVIEHHAISVYSDGGEFLGQVDPHIGHRLSRLMEGGNTYAAAILVAGDDGISIMIHETSRHRSLQKVVSFPTRVTQWAAQARPVREGDLVDHLIAADAGEDEEDLIEEDELQTAWSEGE